MELDKYRPRLSELLRHKGVDTSRNPTSCPNASAHRSGDSNPSFSVTEKNGVESCKCFACGIGGGIYDMIGWFEKIPDLAGQYQFAERFFGGSSYAPPARGRKRSDFKCDPMKMEVLEKYLRSNPKSEHWVRKFLADRASYSTGGGTSASPAGTAADYPESAIPFFLENLFYWPGLDIARHDLDKSVFYGCGIPQVGQSGSQSFWNHSGIALKLGHGYKLHYYEKKYCDNCKDSQGYREAIGRGEAAPEKLLECGKHQAGGFCHRCQKINTVAGRVFPMPLRIDASLPVVLVEGEMDALSCVAAGIKNVFATGGINGLTAPKVEEHLLDASEIILMFDGDEKGRKASGIEPLGEKDSIKVIPQIIRRAGYAGKIRLAELPQDKGGNDPDALVIAGKLDVITRAIESAKEYVPAERPKRTKTIAMEFFSDLSIKRLKHLLQKLEKSRLDAEDVQPFITACKKAFNDDETGLLLREWGATQKEINHKGDTTPAFLLEIAPKYLSRYLQRQLEKELTPVEELLRTVVVENVKIPLDFEGLVLNDNVKGFISSCSVRTAALMLADIFDGRIVYNAAKNVKGFYFFNGHVWEHGSDVIGIIYDTLRLVVHHFLRLNKDSDIDEDKKKKKKGWLMDVLKKIDSQAFRMDVKREFSGLKVQGDVYHNSDNPEDPLQFDGEAIKETLTLADGVLDFSGEELVFRQSRKEEYRYKALNYKMEDVEKGGTCEKIWKFMRGNFKNEDTLQTLMYSLSLIPSRTFYKYGSFWIGGKNTGKSTTMRIIEEMYDGDIIYPLGPDIIAPKGKTFANGHGPTPDLVALRGKGAAFVSEPEDGAYLNAGLWKKLTGGDKMTARGLNESPKIFRNTAHIVINTNHLPKFDRNDSAVITRAVVIPFLVSHEADEDGVMQPDQFVEYLKPEFPAFIRLLAEYYIRFKYKHKRELPISKESKAHKMGYIAEVETDLDKYVSACVEFEPQSTVVIRDAYDHYLSYYEYDEDHVKRKEALTHTAFTRKLLKNHKDKLTEQMVRMKRDGESKPMRCFKGMRLKSFEEIADQTVAKDKVDIEQHDDEGSPW